MQPLFSHTDQPKSFPCKYGKTLSAALGIILLHTPLIAEEADDSALLSARKNGKGTTLFPAEQEIHNTPSLKELDKRKETYEIKFNNIAINEYIRFTSKISGLNFIFNEEDVQFNVTIVSEEPVTPYNIVSILIQILRINGLIVLEQDGNLLITRARNVSQLATVVSSDLPPTESRSPLVTRVFRIKNASLDTVAAVIKPMLSDSSLLEVSPQTKQLIVTDITTNIDKISSLLAALDAPHSPLEVETYVANYVDLQELIRLSTQILTPFTEGNTLLFVPQRETATIFIVSTPYLIDRALSVFEDLDNEDVNQNKASARNLTVFLYPLQYKSGEDFLSSLEDLEKQLVHQGASQKLIDCLQGARWIKASHSILFLSDDETLSKLRTLLSVLDTPLTPTHLPPPKSSFFVYKIKSADPEQFQNSLDQMAENLQKAPQPDYSLIDALTSMKYIQDSNSIVFTGDDSALEKLKTMVEVFDVIPPNHQASQFFIYNPKKRTGEELKEALEEIVSNLKSAGYGDPAMAQAVSSMQWTPSTNSMIFSGNPETLSRIQALLSSLDEAPETFEGGKGPHTFYIYKLQNAPGNTVLENLKRISENLKDSRVANVDLVKTLQGAKWIKDNNSILITGNTATVDQAKALLQEFDVSTPALVLGNKSSFFIYKPIHQAPQALIQTIKDLGKDLSAAGLADADLLNTIESIRYVDSTQSILITGTSQSLDKVKELIERVDVLTPAEAQIQQLGQYTFLIYKVQYVPAPQLIAALKGLTGELQRTSAITVSEVDTINSLKYIKETNSILFTGSADTLKKIELLVKKFDVPSLSPKTDATPVSNFVVYTPRFQPGDELIKILDEFQQNLISAGVANKELFDTITNLKWVPRTCSLIISGDPESIARVEDLLKRFDVPTSEPSVNQTSIDTIQNTSFLIYKLQYHQGNEILTALKQIATDLTPGTATGNQNLLNAINSLQWIRVTNSLLASGEGDTLAKLRDLVQNLDVPLRQVFIEVLVIETELSNTQNFGLQWGGKMQFLNKFAAGTGNFPANTTSTSASQIPFNTVTQPFQGGLAGPPPSTGAIPFMSGFDLGVIGDIIMHKGRSFLTLGSLVNALQTDSDSTIILNPKIITQDNQTSTVFVGTNIPYVGSLVTTSSQILSSSSNIEYRDIGFNLTVTPTIGNSDVVTLDISNDISAVVSSASIGQINVTGSANNQIQGVTTSHTSMATKVHVPNKHFVVLSGMITDSKSRYKSAIPCLGGLPVIGALFSENDRVNSKSNVIIFMRPHIINTYEEYKEVTDHQEGLYKNAASLPVLKEEFDAGVDMLKTPEDE